MSKPNIQLIKYDNRRNASQFDLLLLENLLQRADLSDALRNYQKNNFYTILICTSGSGKHTIDFVDYSYQKGTILTIRKDQIHRYHYSESKGYLFVFTEDFFIQFFENGNAYTESYSLNGASECVVSQVNSGTYELLSDTQLSTTYGSETNSSLVIVEISQTQLILRDESGSTHNTITLDKTQG